MWRTTVCGCMTGGANFYSLGEQFSFQRLSTNLESNIQYKIQSWCLQSTNIILPKLYLFAFLLTVFFMCSILKLDFRKEKISCLGSRWSHYLPATLTVVLLFFLIINTLLEDRSYSYRLKVYSSTSSRVAFLLITWWASGRVDRSRWRICCESKRCKSSCRIKGK